MGTIKKATAKRDPARGGPRQGASEQTKLQRAHRRLDVLTRAMMNYHPQRMSQTTIAEVLGVSRQAVSKSLRRTDPNDPEVRQVAALLGWLKLHNQPRL